jgi:acetyltransferase-like isoleucine patch superfamily enzyme
MPGKLKRIAKRLLHVGLPVPAWLRPGIRGAYRGGVVLVEACALVRKFVWVEPVLRSVCSHVGKDLRAERLPYMRGEGRIELGDRVNLSGRSCFYFVKTGSDMPVIKLGDNVFLGNACTLSCARRIEIGDHCLISACVRIHDNDGHPLDPERRMMNDKIRECETAAVVIEKNVWVGADAAILKGVRIGENAVIGAGAVVTQDVPPNTVVAGNPAVVVKQL